MNLRSGLIAFLGGVAILWYYICLLYLGFVQEEPPTGDGVAFAQFMGLSLATLSGTLATYVGMVLGIKTTEKQPNPNPVAMLVQTQNTTITRLQVVAAIAYVVSLLVALYAWWQNQESSDPTIVALGKSFLGLIGGVLAVILNINPSSPPSPNGE